MKKTLKLTAALLLLSTINSPLLTTALAQGTAFTYQGRLEDGGAPANGTYDLEFRVFDAVTSGAQQGSLVTINDLGVSNGLFTVVLDPGAGVFTGAARWLDVAVRPGESVDAYANLTPRQAISTAPYALRASSADVALRVTGVTVNTNLASTALGDGTTASGPVSTALGGDTTASGYGSTAIGLSGSAGGTAAVGMGYAASAGGDYAVAIGSSVSAAGSVSMALGHWASAAHSGSFVWGDNRDELFSSTGTNQFLIRASGGVGINTNNPNGAALAVNGNVTVGGTVNGTFAGNGAGVTNVDLALNSGGAITLSGGFVLASSPGVGSNPRCVTAVDVNSDGKPDLISANGNANTLTVLTNDGSGGFVLASSPSVGNGPQSVTSADVNGDGKPDLISANANANTLTVLNNNGNGHFVVSASPSVGSNPRSVTAADVNGDGKPDLISANIFSNSLSVLTNNGNGGFVLASSPDAGLNPYSVTAADMNEDGRPDLISVNGSGATLRMLTNTGSGGFELASSTVVGFNPYSVTAADVNGDGKPDLVSANYGSDYLTVLTNNGSGGVVRASYLGVGSFPYSVRAADVNGDGKPDLVSANSGANTLTVLTNNGSGGFVVASSPTVGNTPVSVTTADVDGDGRMDLISANANASTLTVLLNTATFSGRVAGDGSGLTSLNAGNLTGAVPSAALTSVPAASLTGTIADGRLSANVALRAGGNTFTGNQTIEGNVGIGLLSPAYPIDVQNGLAVGRFTTTNNANGAVLSLRNTTPSPTYLGAINFEDSGTPGQIGYLAGGQMAFRVGGIERMTLDASGLTVNGAFVSASDRNVKQDFAAVDAQEVLEKVAALPLQSWSYTNRPGVKHVGPMAQDFHAAFGLGEDDKHIATVDADGVALAAIQGLNEKVEARSQRSEISIQKLEAEVKAKDARIAELEHRLSAIEALLQK